MNTSEQIPYIRNGKKWYLLSIFYGRENWAELISRIMQFYQERKNHFCDCFFAFSKIKGEHIDVVFTTHISNNNIYTTEIETYFQTFLGTYPSMSTTLFPYGKAIWCNYPNDSLEWNKFCLHEYTNLITDFYQCTNSLVLKLLGNDFSEDAFFSIGLYLITKGLCCFGKKEQENIFSQLQSDISIYLKNSKEMNSRVSIFINKFDSNAIGNTIESYINENEYSVELKNWQINVISYFKKYNYQELYILVTKILMLNQFYRIALFELVKMGFYRTEKSIYK
jgi:hypothetical protein